MAEFQEVMRQWRRMCKAYTTDDESCCEGCPVVDFREHGCGAIFEMEDSTDWQKYEDTIMAWAAEHPEPVYPRWGEWMIEQGLCGADVAIITQKAYERIPADIAQKLGIQPKE